MKVLLQSVTLALVVLVAASASFKSEDLYSDEIQVRGIIENTINSTLNKILANLSNPLNIPDIALQFPGDVLNGGVNTSSLKITGIKDLVATNITLSLVGMHLEMTIKIPEILINLKYWADMLLAELVPLYGSGRMGITFDDTVISISGTANLTGGISISKLVLGIGVGNAVFDLHGLIDNEEFSALVSTVLNDNVVDFLDNNQAVISSIISPIAETLINSILKGSSGNSSKTSEEHMHEQLVQLAQLF